MTVNSTAPRTDIASPDLWPEGDSALPEQFGGPFKTLLPGVSTFQLPDLAQLWEEFDATDTREKVNGQPNPYHGKVTRHLRLKFDRNSPLVVVGGPYNGETMTVQFTTLARRRTKEGVTPEIYVSDLAYFLEISLANKTRPKTPAALKATVTQYSGKLVRFRHGLSARCRVDAVRYIESTQPIPGSTPPQVQKVAIIDPAGTKGCGARFYTDAFKLDDNTYSDQIECDCGAMLRGFAQVDTFLPPLGVAGK